MKLLYLRLGALALLPVCWGTAAPRANAQSASSHSDASQSIPTPNGLTITRVGEGRFNIQIRPTSLSLALEAIYRAGNNPRHVVDTSAQAVTTSNITLINSDWHSAVKEVADRSGFTMRDENQVCLVQKKTPSLIGNATPTQTKDGEQSALTVPTTTPTLAPPNGVLRRSNSQTLPNLDGSSSTSTDPKDQQIIPLYVRHIYVGGIAQLFQNSSVIGTQPFVSPMNSGGFGGGGRGGFGGGGRGGGFGGGGFGGGGFGGGGFGGGGFGGGGFGGGGFGGGGFGGGGFGGGGFGGGGFGGGGFGGNSFGGGGFGGNSFGGGGFGRGF